MKDILSARCKNNGEKDAGRLLIITHQLIDLQPYLGACPQSMDIRRSLFFSLLRWPIDGELALEMGGKQGSGEVMERVIPHLQNSSL